MLLDEIDAHAKHPGGRATMDDVWNALNDEQKETLKAACGLTHDGKHKREWELIARWIGSLGVTSKKVRGTQISVWADKQLADG